MDFFTDIVDSPTVPLPNPDGPLNETGLLKSAGMGFMRGAAELGGAAVIAAGGVVDLMEGGAFDHGTADKVFKFYDDVIRPARDFWTPDPESTSMAGNIAGGIAGLGAPLMLGPAAIPALVGSATINTGVDLVESGVDPVTATGVGIAGGVATGLMIKIPASGTSIAKTLGLIVANPAIGAVQTGAQGALLEVAGYGEVAKSFDPFDPEARAVDLAMGAFFGGMAQYSRARGKMPIETIDALDTINEAQHITKTNILGKKDHEKHTTALNKAIDDSIEGRQVDVISEVGDAEARAVTPDEGGKEIQKASKEFDKEIEQDAKIIVGERTDEGVKTTTNVSRETKVIDEFGEPKVVYHGTTAPDFSVFDKTNDIGFHFGTKDHAASFTEGLAGARTIPARLDLRNPLRMDDPFSWDAEKVISAASQDPRVSESSLDIIDRKVAELLEPSTNKFIPETQKLALVRDWLEDLGFDGIVYENLIEGKVGAEFSDSYVVFRPEQIEFALSKGKSIDAKQESAIIPTKKVAAPKPPKELDLALERDAEIVAEIERFALENPDMVINIGTDANGEPINIRATEYLDEGRIEVQRAREKEDFYRMAAECLMR